MRIGESIRDLLIMADFESSNWLWQYRDSKTPVPFWDGQLVGYGLPLSIQKRLYDWFTSGVAAFKAGTLDEIQFHEEGRKLAESFSAKAEGRFPVRYAVSVGNSSKGLFDSSTLMTYQSDKNFHPGSMWEGQITICFSRPSAGWILMAILSTAFLKHHVIHLSDVFNPFPDMVAYLTDISNKKPSKLRIDEEGEYSYLTAWNIDNLWLELVVETEDYLETEKEGVDVVFSKREVLAVVNRKNFMLEFDRRFKEFLYYDYTNLEWIDAPPGDYTPEEIADANLRSFDFSAIAEYLSIKKNDMRAETI